MRSKSYHIGVFLEYLHLCYVSIRQQQNKQFLVKKFCLCAFYLNNPDKIPKQCHYYIFSALYPSILSCINVMSSRKKDLEIVYNLEWKNKPANGDEKSNMVGILDIPATTLDWETFKSYLLKNSGAADDNVKVSYIDSEQREQAINSQLDFEIALYTFRQKARMNEIITLKLGCINNRKNTSSSVKSIAKGLSEVQVKMKPKIKKTEEPPEWFLIYMKKFKEELIEEMSTICSSKAHQMNLYHARKLKADSYKRTRKTPFLLGEPVNDKELSKSAKIERKLESKLEKLEHKTMKIKAKKMALRGSSDSDVGRSSSKNETSTYFPPHSNTDMSMNASVIKKEFTPHMSGGEPYYQTWEVCNSGTLPWNSDTELRYAWGSQALKPLKKEVPCPPLQPGEKGCIAVFLEIPKTPGTYECYWHFYHKGRRFGHWLGCDIIVDDPPVKNIPYVPSPTYDVINIKDMYELILPTTWTVPAEGADPPERNADDITFNPDELENPFTDTESQKCAPSYSLAALENNQGFGGEQREDGPKDLIDGKEDLKGDINFDSDNQSIISISDSSIHTGTSEDFVVLKMSPTSPKLEKDNSSNDFALFPPNLTKMNVSSLENIDNIDNLFTKLSMEETNSSEIQMDNAICPAKEEEIETYVPSEPNEQEALARSLSNSVSVVQQIPIDLSNKSNASSEINAECDRTGYAYIQYKGRKIPMPKRHLRPEFLATAETVPESDAKNVETFKIDEAIQRKEPEEESIKYVSAESFRTSTPSEDVFNNAQQQQIPPQQDAKAGEYNQNSYCSLPATAGTDFASNCAMNSSMCSSVNENRFFVFPQYYPGYEVVPVYGYNTVGEVLVNDWTTGLNYAACLRYPNPSNQYYNNSTANSTSNNTSRGCSSIPNSAGGSPPHQSPGDGGGAFRAESANVNSCNGQCAFDQYVNVNSSSFEEPPRSNLYTSSASNCSSSENVQSNASASSQQKAHAQDSRANTNRVGVPDLLSGATVMATSAINTARSVFNMFVPPRSTDCGRWQNGHWISTNPESKREKNLRLLYEMGFYNRDLNATLLARYHDDINMVISELLE